MLPVQYQVLGEFRDVCWGFGKIIIVELNFEFEFFCCWQKFTLPSPLFLYLLLSSKFKNISREIRHKHALLL